MRMRYSLIETGRLPAGRPRRRGSIIHEAMLAVALSAALIGLVTQILATAQLQRMSAHHRFLARHETANVLEQMMAQSWEAPPPEDSTTLLSTVGQQVPHLKVTVDHHSEEDSARRITVQAQWGSTDDAHSNSFKLVGWRYPGNGENP